MSNGGVGGPVLMSKCCGPCCGCCAAMACGAGGGEGGPCGGECCEVVAGDHVGDVTVELGPGGVIGGGIPGACATPGGVCGAGINGV